MGVKTSNKDIKKPVKKPVEKQQAVDENVNDEIIDLDAKKPINKKITITVASVCAAAVVVIVGVVVFKNNTKQPIQAVENTELTVADNNISISDTEDTTIKTTDEIYETVDNPNEIVESKLVDDADIGVIINSDENEVEINENTARYLYGKDIDDYYEAYSGVMTEEEIFDKYIDDMYKDNGAVVGDGSEESIHKEDSVVDRTSKTLYANPYDQMLYSGAGETYAPIGILWVGDKVTVNFTTKYGWCNITTEDGTTGFTAEYNLQSEQPDDIYYITKVDYLRDENGTIMRDENNEPILLDENQKIEYSRDSNGNIKVDQYGEPIVISGGEKIHAEKVTGGLASVAENY